MLFEVALNSDDADAHRMRVPFPVAGEQGRGAERPRTERDGDCLSKRPLLQRQYNRKTFYQSEIGHLGPLDLYVPKTKKPFLSMEKRLPWKNDEGLAFLFLSRSWLWSGNARRILVLLG